MYFFGGPAAPRPVEAEFVSRPNRFLVLARLTEDPGPGGTGPESPAAAGARAAAGDAAAGTGTPGEIVKVHCPNPGRLWEIFHPGRRLLLVPAFDPGRRTSWSLAAAFYRGRYVPMNASAANRAARELVLPALFPDLPHLRGEYSLPEDTGKKDRSRFDFYFELPPEPGGGPRRCLMEVKSCTLVEEGIAMFPDAPTQRGRRHVEELAALQRSGAYESHILFVLNSPEAEKFVPNFYTDPEFAAALRDNRKDLHIHCVSVNCRNDGLAELVNTGVPIDFGPVALAGEDRGFLILVFQLPAPAETEGRSGREGLPGAEELPGLIPGWYTGVMEAPAELRAMERRILRKRTSPGKKAGPRPPGSLDGILSSASVLRVLGVYTGGKKPGGSGEPDEDLKSLGRSFFDELSGLSGPEKLPGSAGKNQKELSPLRIHLPPAENMALIEDCLFRMPAHPLFWEPFTALLFRYRHSQALET